MLDFGIGTIVVLVVTAACAVNIVVKGCAPVVDWFARQRAAGAAECHRLASDADFQNTAFVSGDLSTAWFGRYPPLHEPIATSGVRIVPTVGLRPPWRDQ